MAINDVRGRDTGIDEGVVEVPGAEVANDLRNVVGEGEPVGLARLGGGVADVDGGCAVRSRLGDRLADAGDDEARDHGGEEAAGADCDEVGGAERLHDRRVRLHAVVAQVHATDGRLFRASNTDLFVANAPVHKFSAEVGVG